jgi:DNA ligase-1
MLAPSKSPELDDIEYPMLMSPKLDGIRCLIKEGQILSRSGKPLRNINLEVLLAPLILDTGHVFDGELYLHGETFQYITSRVMATDKPLDGIHLYAFDCMTIEEWEGEKVTPLIDRITLLTERAWFLDCSDDVIHIIPQHHMTSATMVRANYDKWLQDGYEGAILRDPESLYKHGRATKKQGTMFKLKSWTDYDGVIVSVHEGKRLKAYARSASVGGERTVKNELGRNKKTYKKEDYEPSGSFGYFTVKLDNSDITVEIGCWDGITDEIRKDLWKRRGSLPGEWCRFKGMSVGVKDKPRMPKDFAFRDAK